MEKKGGIAVMLNQSQQYVFDAALEWWKKKDVQTFEISGPPGSGKTYLINQIIRALGVDMTRVAPMAYTGSAAINMRSKGMLNAATIFSWCYDCTETPILDDNGNIILDPVFNMPKTRVSFRPKPHLTDIDLIIVDEGPMVPEDMKEVIDSMGIPVIVAGDLDQLPPIFGRPGYLRDPRTVYKLTKIMRQAGNNTIIQFSQMLIHNKPLPIGHHGNVDVIYEDQLTDDMISKSRVIICGKNATRDRYIDHIRHDMLNIYNDYPQYGERLVCRKNNWKVESNGINLTNGLLGSCLSTPDPSVYDRTNHTFLIDFKPDIAPDAYFHDVDIDYRYLNGDKATRDAIMNTKFASGNKFEYGYAITTHMSQGSEFDTGIYIEEFLNKDINHKLNYVGITRFKKHCIYVKRRPKYTNKSWWV